MMSQPNVVQLPRAKPASTLRPVRPMNFPASEMAALPSWRPRFAFVQISDLLIDDGYQRELKPQSVKLIRKIATSFNWTHLKPPVVVEVGKQFHVINGQHTAIAAATIGLTELPVFIVLADDMIDRAMAFVSHNTDNVRVTKLDVHRALVAAGDPVSTAVQKTCETAGVKMVELGANSRVGETKSVTTILKCAKVHGNATLGIALGALVRAKRAPITEYEIKAACVLADEIGPGAAPKLYLAIRAGGDDAVAQARMNGLKTKRQAWKCMIELWRKGIR